MVEVQVDGLAAGLRHLAHRLGAIELGAVVHLDQRVADETGLEVLRDVVEAVMLRMTARERLGDRHRPVHEVLLWRQQGALDALAGQVAQREQGLQAGDATAGDYDPEWAE